MGRSEAFNGNFTQAFRWTEATGLVGLGFTRPGHIRSEARAISRDGSTIVGFSGSGNSDAFIWTQQGGMQILPGGEDWGTASGVNHDGSVMVGAYGIAPQAAMWRNGQRTDLGVSPGYLYSHALAVNDDGTVAVGLVTGFGNSAAAIWTPSRGIERLSDYLTFRGIAIPQGVHLFRATGVSADGNTIVGYTGDPGTVGTQGFVVTIPAPATITLLLGLAAFRRRR